MDSGSKRMNFHNPRQNLFISCLSRSFAGFAAEYPVQTAFLLNRLVLPDGSNFVSDPEEYRERIVWVVVLMHLLPEPTAAAVMKEMRCFTDSDQNIAFIKDFIFETAGISEIGISVIIRALGEFAELESGQYVDGIDRARILTESVFGTKRMTQIIDEMTDALEDESAARARDVN